MASEINNKFLINAPAGSGKTTRIRETLENLSLSNPKSKILCITYTNRAVDELKNNLYNPNIEISTIHSYINKLVSPYFKEKEVINLYFIFFNDKLVERINNEHNDDHVKESNQKYCEKHGISSLSIEVIKNNLTEISYGEIPFTSLYYGKLSHDDLILFASELCKKFPAILKKIYLKYKYIFIDEYQDTPTKVLEIFNDVANYNKELKLYLLGDRMQQIYPNYDGSFEKEFDKYDNSDQLKINYRSVKAIVDILNNIYNDADLNQEPSSVNLISKPKINPSFILTKKQEDVVEFFETKFPEALKLYLMNKEKYKEIGAYNLYYAYDKMDAYKYGRKYSANDILSDISSDNPDFLYLCLINILEVLDNYQKGNYGKIISIFKLKNKFFNQEAIKLQINQDKTVIKNILQDCYDISIKEKITIKEILETFSGKGLLKESIIKLINDNEDYKNVLEVLFIEFKKLISFLNNIYISTQHGVKGESHETVIFITNENKNTPNIRMYSFFELWSTLEFSLPEIENFYYSYRYDINKFEFDANFNHSLLNKAYFESFKERISEYCVSIIDKYKEDKFFNKIYLSDFNKYNDNSITTNAKKLFSFTEIEGILFAYKIFYVGCSRARKNLIVVCDENKIESFRDKFEKKLKSIGFNVETQG